MSLSNGLDEEVILVIKKKKNTPPTPEDSEWLLY